MKKARRIAAVCFSLLLTASVLTLAGCAQTGSSAGENIGKETEAAGTVAMNKETAAGTSGNAGGADMRKTDTIVDWTTYDRGQESDEELRERIGTLSFEVTQNASTEMAFTGQYDHFFEKGIYVDIVSGEPLFSSLDKYDSGCGWPAFTQPISEDMVVEYEDNAYGMKRVEVRSSGADSHLGHVFTDGPKESGGLRYCINSASIRFVPYDELEEQGYGEYKALFDEE